MSLLLIYRLYYWFIVSIYLLIYSVSISSDDTWEVIGLKEKTSEIMQYKSGLCRDQKSTKWELEYYLESLFNITSFFFFFFFSTPQCLKH